METNFEEIRRILTKINNISNETKFQRTWNESSNCLLFELIRNPIRKCSVKIRVNNLLSVILDAWLSVRATVTAERWFMYCLRFRWFRFVSFRFDEISLDRNSVVLFLLVWIFVSLNVSFNELRLQSRKFVTFYLNSNAFSFWNFGELRGKFAEKKERNFVEFRLLLHSPVYMWCSLPYLDVHSRKLVRHIGKRWWVLRGLLGHFDAVIGRLVDNFTASSAKYQAEHLYTQ